jgi:hypothetical protein
VRSREELRWEAGELATLLCSKSRRATWARLACWEGGGPRWPWECEWDEREVVEWERCGRSEGPLMVCCRWDVAAADMARAAQGAPAGLGETRRTERPWWGADERLSATAGVPQKVAPGYEGTARGDWEEGRRLCKLKMLRGREVAPGDGDRPQRRTLGSASSVRREAVPQIEGCSR